MHTAQQTGDTRSQPAVGPVIRAAGGLLTRMTPEGQLLAIVHRRRYGGDWTLPKGKLDGNENWETAALREVKEETGTTARIAGYAGAINYLADRKPKIVLFFRMEPADDHQQPPKEDGEVADVAWLPVQDALTRLSYPDERRLVDTVFGLQGETDARLRSVALRQALWNGQRAKLGFLGLVDHSADRLAASLLSYEIELEFLIARQLSGGSTAKVWPTVARALVQAAWDAQRRGAIDAGWRCLSAAQRTAVFGLSDTDRQIRATVLREEGKKLGNPWRPKAIEEAVANAPGNHAPDAFALAEAMFLRDEHSNNEYFKLGLVGSQLKLLSWILILAVLFSGVVLFIPLIGIKTISGPLGPNNVTLDGRLILLASLFGIIGATFSAILSTAQADTSGRIPQRLSGVALTFSRAVLGAPAALLIVAFLQTGLLKVGSVDPSDPFLILVVAFAAGFSERLVVRAVESVSGKSESGERTR